MSTNSKSTKRRRRLAGAIAGAATGLAFLAPTLPAAAAPTPPPTTRSVAQGRFCDVVPTTFRWRAKYFYEGEYVGVGPKRLWRSTAQRDCDRYEL